MYFINNKKKIYFFLLFIPLFIFPLFYFINTNKETTKSLSLNKQTIQNGDIILRRENNRISDLFAQANDSEYSHIGTIIVEKDKIKIIHIEYTENEKDLKIVTEAEFLKFASAYAIYRPKEAIDLDKFEKIVQKLIKQNPKFDLKFLNTSKDNKIYCTELVNKINSYATNRTLRPTFSHYLGFDFISVKFFTNPLYFKLIESK